MLKENIFFYFKFIICGEIFFSSVSFIYFEKMSKNFKMFVCQKKKNIIDLLRNF